jgi:2-polyprenyl-3-methyl-5-hydroxy-6-metoxy-1,4-benzoquinol methylase
MEEAKDYREKIYKFYRTSFRNNISVAQKDYERRVRFYKRRFRAVLPDDKDASILDLGCGEGFFLYFMEKSGYKNLYGVEICTEQIHVAKQFCKRVEIYNHNLLDFLQETSQTFDFVLLDNVLEHFKKDEIFLMLELIHKRLNVSGKLVISVPNGGSIWGIPHCFMDFTHEVYFLPTSLTEVLIVSGYEILDLRGEGPIPLDVMSTLRSLFYYPVSFFTLLLLKIMVGGGGRTKILHIPDTHIMAIAEKK